MTKPPILAALPLIALLAAPAQAGWTFRQSTRTTGGPQGDTPPMVSQVQLEGGDARIVVEKGPENPMMGSGGYMLFRSNAPQGMFMVNTTKKTYMKFDPEELSQMMSPMGKGAGGGIKMSIDDVKVEKVLEEPGEPILGYSTTHCRFKKAFVMTMDFGVAMMGKSANAHEVVEDVWVTNDVHFDVAGFGVALHQLGNNGMFAGAQKLVEAEKDAMKGFQLRRVMVDHSIPHGEGIMGKRMSGKEMTTTTTMEITDLQRAPLAATVFAIPAGFTETQMMQPNAKAPNLEDEH